MSVTPQTGVASSFGTLFAPLGGSVAISIALSCSGTPDWLCSLVTGFRYAAISLGFAACCILLGFIILQFSSSRGVQVSDWPVRGWVVLCVLGFSATSIQVVLHAWTQELSRGTQVVTTTVGAGCLLVTISCVLGARHRAEVQHAPDIEALRVSHINAPHPDAYSRAPSFKAPTLSPRSPSMPHIVQIQHEHVTTEFRAEDKPKIRYRAEGRMGADGEVSTGVPASE